MTQEADLRLSLLGPPTITWRGEPLTISRRQVRAILYRLAANLRPQPRDQLCTLFWPDAPLAHARRSLTHLLTHLRQALPDPDLLEVTNEYISLDPRKTWCDTLALEQLYSEWHRTLSATPGSERDDWQSLEHVERVVQSYRGPFLSGFILREAPEFEAWVNHERQYYECRFLEILLDLVDEYQQRKDYTHAIAHALRYLQIDNLAEEVHCKLIELYAALGDRAAAERQFERCAAALEQELGISPSPKTWAMYQAATSPRPAGLPYSPLGLTIQPLSNSDVPFIGRAGLLKAIDQAYNLAASGRGKAILVHGEAGSGKSRLLQQIVAHYHCNGTVLYSACNPGLSELSYHPIAEAFRPLIENRSQDLKVSPLWLAEAARLLPEIYARYPDLPSPLPARPEETRRRLFEALAQIANSLQTRFRPLVICLDNLHWADAATLEWLIYLANRLAFQGLSYLLIVGAYQDDEADRLLELRSALKRLGVLEEHLLAPFEDHEVHALLRHYFPESADLHELATRLRQISGGNPLLTIEALQALIESHMLPDRMPDANHLPISRVIEEHIHQRLASLDQRQRQMMEFLSVLSCPLTTQMVAEAFPSEEMETLQVLDELSTLGLLTEETGVYRFANELLRLVIYQQIRYGRRRLLHHQCSRLLEKFYPEEIALLAWQFEQCGETARAAEYALRAGEDAVQALAYPQALDFFSRALDLLKQEANSLKEPQAIADNYRRQITALTQRGRVYRSLGEMQHYQDDVAEQGRLAAALDDRHALALAYLREANAHRWFCRYSQALGCAQRALELGHQDEDGLLQARALREIGLVERALGNYARSEACLNEALALFRELEETGYEIHTLCNLSALALYTEDASRAERLAHQALARCEQAQLFHLRRIALGDLGAALAASGRYDQGKECLLSSLELAQEIADRTQEIFCLNHLGWLENCAGRPDAALIYLRDGLALAERLDSRSEQSRLYAGLAQSHRLLGNIRLARGFALKALELARQHNRPYDQRLAEQILSEIG
jgi:DNA-binding SARP family transcriptional activator